MVVTMPAMPSINKPNVDPSEKCRKVRLCFYEPRGESEPWINRLAAFSGKHFVSHVEILFEDDSAASIFAEETVFFRQRTYSNPYYRIKMFLVTNSTYWLMYDYAWGCSQRQVCFSNTKMLCGPWFGCTNWCPDSTFCSEFVTHTLQVGGVDWAMKLDAGRITPSQLLDRMNHNETTCFDSTAFKLAIAFK